MGEQFGGQLLAVVGVDQRDRVVCHATGCGHGVYRRIHVVRHDNGTVGVYGSDCFQRLFGNLARTAPRYGSGEGRELTTAERELLVQNTQALIEQFEQEHRVAAEQARLRREQQEKVERAAAERAARLEAEAARRRPPTPAELATVEAQAKAIVRQRFNVDPDAPGWRGLVLAEARKLLGR